MQGTISFDGTLSGGITGGGGGGSEVTITPTLQSGTKIADYEIDSTPGELYAPTPEALSAQSPLTISSGVISIDLSDYQEKLTAGSYISIDSDNEISCNPPITNVWYTPEPDVQQDVLIGKFTVNDVTQNVYAPSGGGSSTWDYSTTEVDTGQKWIDGKTIYCRVFNLPDLVLNDNNWNNNVLGTSNIHIIKFDGFIGLQGYDINLPLNYYRQNTEFITTILAAGYSDINIRPNMNAGVNVKGLNCTIFYIKNS